MSGFSPANLMGTACWADPNLVAQRYSHKPGQIILGRSPHDHRNMISMPVKSHVFLCAETQETKSRAIIINNLLEWPGSIVAVSSKADLTEICANRRGNGDEHCEGLHQRVLVADPKREARIRDALRCWFNPLDQVDPEDPMRGAMRIVEYYTLVPAEGDSAEWTKKGMKLAAHVIAHIMTSKKYKKKSRNLVTVLKLILAGKEEDYLILKKAFEAGDSRLKEMGVPSGFTLLLKEMSLSTACDGLIASYALSLMKSDSGHEEGFESVRMNALNALEWLFDKDMRQFVTGEGMREEQRLDPQSVKTDPHGVSVFINSLSSDKEFYAGWEKLMFSALIDAHRDVDGAPALGHKTLFCIDEFLQYGKLQKIENSINEIASAGCVLFLSVQKLGPLKRLYKEGWETFSSGADVSIWFGLNEVEGSLKHVSTLCGEMHLELHAQQKTVGEQIGQSFGTTETTSTGGGENGSEANGESYTEQRNSSISRGSGTSSGHGSSTNGRAGTIIDLLPGSSHSKNTGRNSNLTRVNGTSSTNGQTVTKTQGWNATWQESKANQYTQNFTRSYSLSVSQQFQKRQLLSVDEARIFLADVTERPEDPRFPGLALVIKRNEPPTIVRKSFYDRDAYFAGKFTPSRDHAFIPISQQPMLEYMYTPEHHFDFGLPDRLVKAGCQLRPWKRSKAGTFIPKGQPFAELLAPKDASSFMTAGAQRVSARRVEYLNDEDLKCLRAVRAPFDLQIMAVETVHMNRHVRRFIIRRLGHATLPSEPCIQKNRELIGLAGNYTNALIKGKKADDEAARQLAQEDAEAKRLLEEEKRRKKVIRRVVGGVLFVGMGMLGL